MRIEPLCDIEMVQHGPGVWLKPYGEKEAAGYASGDGKVHGARIRGSLEWSNHPRRREDGVWCPDAHGYITTDDGVKILIAIQGLSILEEGADVRRGIVARVSFQSSDPRYRWLNFILAVAEGEIQEFEQGDDRIRFKVYGCVNEIASGPSAIR